MPKLKCLIITENNTVSINLVNMIGKLTGKTDLICSDHVIVDVNGVGYKVFCSIKTLSVIQARTDVSLLIEAFFKEDRISLYGFLNESEKNWFNDLCKISGVGSKMALNLLGVLSEDDIITAVNSEDKKAFSSVSGVGPKLASRLVTELKHILKSKLDSGVNLQACQIVNVSKSDKRIIDAISALENLGYQRSVAYNVVMNILKENEKISLEALITQSLKKITK